MHIIILVLLIAACIYGPGLWAQHILKKFNSHEYFSGNGFDLAVLLLKDSGLSGVQVEETQAGDHYDPVEKMVRLNRETCGKKTLTAVVVAAHEVGHAMQDSGSYPPLDLRTRLTAISRMAEKIGAGIIMTVPLITAITRVPAAGLLVFIGGFISLGLPILVHLITLPVEFDASFNRAMPFLTNGHYIPPEKIPDAKKILFACTLTYVAGALASLLNIWRWLKILRR